MFKIPKLDDISEKLNEYLDSRIQLIKLDIKVELTNIISSIAIQIISIVLASVVFIFLSIAGALWIGTYYQSYAVGFLVIGGLYAFLFIGVSLPFARDRLKKAIFESIDHSVTQTRNQSHGK